MTEKPLKSYEDVAFLKSPDCRAIRLQLEFLKPEVKIRQHNIMSTIVIFGSARIPEREPALRNLAEIRDLLKEDPDSRPLQQRLRIAEQMVEQSRYRDVARDFARLVSSRCQVAAQAEYVVVTGGGGGIMEAGNQGAHDANAKSIGLNISLPFEQKANPYITPDLSFHFHYFSVRKMHFMLRAKAMCAFPGGFGTMDELFETLTLIQTRKIKPMPVLLFGREFWEAFINWDVLVDRGLISPEDTDIFHYCETAEAAWNHIANFWDGRRDDLAAENTRIFG